MATIAALWWVWLISLVVCGVLFVASSLFGVFAFDDYKAGRGLLGCGGGVVFLLITFASAGLLVLSVVLNFIDYIKA